MVRRFPKTRRLLEDREEVPVVVPDVEDPLPPAPVEGLHDHLAPALGQEIDQLGDPMCDDRLRHQLGEVQGVELLVGGQDALGAVEHERPAGRATGSGWPRRRRRRREGRVRWKTTSKSSSSTLACAAARARRGGPPRGAAPARGEPARWRCPLPPRGRREPRSRDGGPCAAPPASAQKSCPSRSRRIRSDPSRRRARACGAAFSNSSPLPKR